MDRLLKRAGALALSLLLLLGSVNLGLIVPANAEVTGDARTAYRKFVRKLVDRYGIITEASGFPDDESFHGVETVDFIDLTGDGADEMIVTWTEPIREKYERTGYLGIYTYSGGTVSELFRTDFNAGTYSTFTVFRQNGLIAAVYSETRMYEDAIRWQNGRFIDQGDFTPDDWRRVEEASQNGGLVAEEGMISEIVMEHIGLDPSAPMERLLNVARTWGDVSGTPDWVTALDIYGADISGGSGASVEQILSNIAYIGDPGKCKMDTKMARAYADALDAVLASAPNEVWRGMLVDVSGDGFPLMMIAAEDWDDELFATPQVWEYKNGTAIRHDFYQDFSGVRDAYDFRVYHSVDGLLFGAVFSGGGDDPEYDGGQFYRVSKGELTLLHTVRSNWNNRESGWYESSGTRNSWTVDGTSFTGDPYDKFDLTYQYRLFSIGSVAYSTDQELSSASLISYALRAYAQNQSAYPNFTKVTEDDDQYVRDVAKAIADALGGEIAGIYKLADGVYYVVIVINGAEQGALVRGTKVNGKITWKVTQQDASPLSPEDLERLASGLLSQSNMDLDYSKIPGFSSSQEVLDYLQDRLDNMDGVSPNDAAKTDLAAFIETSIAGLCSGSVSGKDNRLTVDASTPGDLASQAQSAWMEFESLLRENDITLNKGIVIVIRILWQNLDWSEPCQLTLDSSLVEALNGCTVRLLLADGRHYIQLSADRLKVLIDRYGSLGIQLSKTGGNTYTINFLDSEDEIIDQLPAAVTIGLPANSMTSTIMASYSGGSDNWGGQYDSSASIISFDARYSGQYEVLENNLQIDDIGDLSEESQAAIRFLVSKGFLTLDGNNFNPSENLTRYQFTQALVGMFFALDRELTTSFEDVPLDSEFYPYVASAEARSIVAGYDDVTFGGEDNMTVEQMLALAARTLMNQKGYTAPTEVEQYLSSFEDWEKIGDWALQQAALAVRENLVDRGGALTPQADITRAQAAVILYRLFLLLYEVPPVALDLPPVTEAEASSGNFPTVIAAAAGGVAVLGGGAGAAWYFLVRKKRAV